MYLNKSDLTAEIAALQAGFPMSDDLAEMLYDLADGVFQMCGYKIDPDDHRQNCLVKFLEVYGTIDTGQNVFAYLTNMFQFVANATVVSAVRLRQNIQYHATGIRPEKYTPEKVKRVKRPPRPVSEPVPKKRAGRPPGSGGRPGSGRRVTYHGTEYTIPELAAKLGKNLDYVYARLREFGYDADSAFGERRAGRRSFRPVVYQGTEYTVPQLAEKLGLSLSTTYHRVTRHGWDADLAFATPVFTRSRRQPR